ncbi:MAG TPA: serine hydrolase domain-containing protein [Longimicrobiales bacterium]|nr:serine hydrolase domain-containing protein [Longimicrobiales bacterium]
MRNATLPTRTAQCGAVLLVLAAAAPARAQQPDTAAINAVFARYDRPGSPGCALAVTRGGGVVFQHGYGYANLDWDIPITPATVFYAGSVSKQFTATAIVLLAERGKLALDDPITKYIPELPDSTYGAVTLRQMLHHISGVADTYAAMARAGIPVADVFSDSAAIALLARQPLNFRPGERYSYSNGAYLLLADVVARVSGESFREFTQRNIFGPLGMTHSHFHDRAGHIVKRRAMSYEPADDTGFVQSYMSNFDKVGAGGLYTTVGDLLTWQRAFFAGRVGGPGFLRTMLTRGVLNDGDTLRYALALVDTAYEGHRIVGHTGSMMGFKADLIRFPDDDLGIAMLCNLGSVRQRTLTLPVADLFLGTAPARNGGAPRGAAHGRVQTTEPVRPGTP